MARFPEEVGGFPSTRGSLILSARGADPAQRREALDELLRLYLPALRAYLLYRRRLDPHRAEDLLQAFVARQVLERKLLCRFDASRGRFRSFLLKSLQNFVFDHPASGGNHVPVAPCEPVAEPDPPVFELEWSRQLLRETLRRMERDCLAEGKPARWELFCARVVGPTLTGAEEPSYRSLVNRFGFRSAEQACNALVTAKRQFERTLRNLIRETEHVATSEEIDAEIADLCDIARRTGPIDMRWDRALAAGLHGPASACPELDETNARELARLLDIQSSREGTWQSAELGELFRDCLGTSVGDYLRPPAAGAPADFADDSPSEHAAVSLPLGELFHIADPPLGLLIAVKRRARRLMSPDASDLPAEIHRVVYFAAIAAALVRHGERISKSAPDVLKTGFEQVAQPPSEDWLRELFQRAYHALER